MPPRKGLATTKKAEKYVYLDSEREELSPQTSSAKRDKSAKKSSPLKDKSTPARQAHRRSYFLADAEDENIDPETPLELPIFTSFSNHGQPCQDSESLHSDQLQQSILASTLFPPNEDALPDIDQVGLKTHSKPPSPLQRLDSPFANLLRKPSTVRNRKAQSGQHTASHPQATQLPTRIERPDPGSTIFSHHRQRPPSKPPIYKATNNMANMIPGGAYVPPNQQRNLRACMVCSIVRTYTQFMNGGCPNCEDIIELTGSSENVNDCTSQVFDGLISVADTTKSWVARYQRLEGYVPGVYATQVEGILPEEIVSAIEAAGINYVPRDGSETEMLPKD
jgi:transcription elongation factor SPT4